jgi:phosphate acetyltransferase
VHELGLPVIDPAADPRRDAIAAFVLERRARAGVTPEQARAYAADPLFFAAGLLRLGEVEGSVNGAVRTTGDVVRAALWVVGRQPGVRTVSSAFYLVVPPFRTDTEEVLTFADCAVVQYPDASQLADIAIAAAHARRAIVGDEPRVAFLSFSTLGSAAGHSVETIRSAIAQVHERDSRLLVSGELQGDAALIASVASRKAAGDPVAGEANVLIFPSLDAGNIAYKLVERLAHARAVGPILQGLAHPCGDLSRGASTDDIVHVAAITALQAAGPGGHR